MRANESYRDAKYSSAKKSRKNDSITNIGGTSDHDGGSSLFQSIHMPAVEVENNRSAMGNSRAVAY